MDQIFKFEYIIQFYKKLNLYKKLSNSSITVILKIVLLHCFKNVECLYNFNVMLVCLMLKCLTLVIYYIYV